MTMRNIKHVFSKSVGTLHVVEVTAGRTETGLAGERNPADMIAAVTAVHGTVLWVSTVEDLSDFGNDDRTKM